LPNVDVPIVKFKISKDYFSQKIYTKHYETLRKDKKGNQTLLGLGLLGVSAGLSVALDNKKESNDTTAKALLGIGALSSGIGGLYLLLVPTPKEYWTKDSVDIKDTLYAFQEDVKSENITLQTEHDRKINYLTTDGDGILTADIRDFYNKLDEDSSLKILIANGMAQPTYVIIQSSYINRIRSNESESEKLFLKADSKLKKSKFIEANSFFEEAVAKYPLAKFATNSKIAMKNIEINIKEEKLEIVRKSFRVVSVNKVPEAFDKAGITPSELSEIGNMIERLSRPNITYVIVNGLGMDLDRYQAENEFNSLNNSQKIYAILAASENISKKQGTSKWEALNAILGIDESICKKFARIESGRLLSN
jgi:hypothetical protein